MTLNPPGPLARTNYLSSPPGPYQSAADPNNPAFDPADVLPAAGFENQALDAEQYHRPLERLHGAGLHEAGVAYGMQISATIGQPGVLVMPGLALDAQGRHIYLGPGGSAEVGPDADVPNTPPRLVPVTAGGAVLPTTALPAGTYYVIAQWRETWNAQGSGSDPNTNFYADTPWLRLVTASGYLPDLHVILGQVVLAVSGGVTVVQSAGYGPAGGPQRTSVSLPAQALHLRRAVTTTTPPGADTAPWGAVRARENGGVEIAVAKGSDQVALVNDSGGNFSTLAVGANLATFGIAANPSISLNSTNGTISVGGHNQRGEVIVHDIANHAAITLAGDSGHVVVGGQSMTGKVRVLNGAGATSDSQVKEVITLDGSTGAATVQQLDVHGSVLVDQDVTFTGTLFDGRDVPAGGTTIPLLGSTTRKVTAHSLGVGSGDYANFGGTATLQITLPKPTVFSAFSFLYYIQSSADYDYGQFVYQPTVVTEIYQVDDTATDVDSSGGPLGDTYPSTWVGATGQTIWFRVRAVDESIDAYAAIVIFWE